MLNGTPKPPVAIPPAARWIVCERASRWVRAFRAVFCLDQRLEKLDRALLETRSCEACQSELSRYPASFVSLEISPESTAECLNLTAWVTREFPDARMSVVFSCDDDPAVWHDREMAFREAGAIATAASIWSLDQLLTRAQYHLTNAPETKMSLEQRFWCQLPWSESDAR